MTRCLLFSQRLHLFDQKYDNTFCAQKTNKNNNFIQLFIFLHEPLPWVHESATTHAWELRRWRRWVSMWCLKWF